MPGSLSNIGGPAQPWVEGTQLEFDILRGDLYRNIAVVLRGTITTDAGFNPATDVLNHYPFRALETVDILMDSETPNRQNVIELANTCHFDGWRCNTRENIPTAAATGYPFELVLPLRFNPDALPDLGSGIRYEVDSRQKGNVTLRVVCGALANISLNIAALAGNVSIMVAKDYATLPMDQLFARIPGGFRRRVVNFDQTAIAGAGVQQIRLPRDGKLRRLAIHVLDANGDLNDAVLGNIQLRYGGTTRPFEGPFADLAAWTRSKAAQPLIGSVDRSNGVTGGYAMLTLDEDGIGSASNMIDLEQNEAILEVTALAACTVFTAAEVLRFPPGFGKN